MIKDDKLKGDLYECIIILITGDAIFWTDNHYKCLEYVHNFIEDMHYKKRDKTFTNREFNEFVALIKNEVSNII